MSAAVKPSSDPVMPVPFPPRIASSWGEDQFGLWMSIQVYGVRQVFRWIQPGEFLMGSPETEPDREADEVQHQVTLSEGYWLADTTCTQALWSVIVSENPSQFEGEQRPVDSVNWHDINDWIKQLNALNKELGLRLPTEAEWEYACRAGSTSAFSFGNKITTDDVNYDGTDRSESGYPGTYRQETVDVKFLPANAWGLYEMHGNVWEWCQDWYGDYQVGDVIDPIGPQDGVRRVLRGGSWDYSAADARSAQRDWSRPDVALYDIGFRLARGQ